MGIAVFIIACIAVAFIYYNIELHEYTKQQKKRGLAIVMGQTRDPINAIYIVRNHILDKYKYAGNFAMWKENADAAMINWMRGPEGEEFGFNCIEYRRLHEVKKGTCIKCSIDGNVTVNILIDLSIGVKTLKAQGGDTICVFDDNEKTGLPYILPYSESTKLGIILPYPHFRL